MQIPNRELEQVFVRDIQGKINAGMEHGADNIYRFRVTSNGESGDGRFDLMLRPYLPGFPGYVIEVKHADSDADDLRALADAALGQIDRKDYAAALRAEGVADIVKIGLAYHRKRVELAVG